MAMASSKVITSNSQANSDLPRQPSLYPSLSTLLGDLQNQQPQQLQQNQSMNMDDLLNNIYSSPPTPPTTMEGNAQFSGASISREDLESKSFDDVWKGIVAGCGEQRQGGAPEKVTLEEYLIGKTGAVGEGEVGVVVNQVGGGSAGAVATGVYAPVEPAVINGGQFSGFPSNGGADHSRLVGPSGGGRGKRRAVEEPPVDKATQQKQKRMIKNRESAARSRERKHAHTVKLETRVTQLEEENARLLREEVEYNKERRKQLMKNLIPVEQKPRRPCAPLGRVNSV